MLTFKVNAQQLTGTWIGVYVRDEPLDKRYFYYRLYLQHKNDSLYGICEALDGQTDIKASNPQFASNVAAYKVFNYRFKQGSGSSLFEMFTGEAVRSFPISIAHIDRPPQFLKLECTVTTPEAIAQVRPLVMFSASPMHDGSIGQLRVAKISDSLPDITSYFSTGTPIAKRRKRLNEVKELSHSLKHKLHANIKERSDVPVLALRERQQEVQRAIEVNSTNISIQLFDNGVIDNDTVSLYFNDVLVLDKKRLMGSPIELELNLDVQKENKLTLFAHNLGDIAPNTAHLLVTSGTRQYSIQLSGSLSKNAVLLLKVLKD
jgi:hypothetical protein